MHLDIVVVRVKVSGMGLAVKKFYSTSRWPESSRSVSTQLTLTEHLVCAS